MGNASSRPECTMDGEPGKHETFSEILTQNKDLHGWSYNCMVKLLPGVPDSLS